MSSEDTYEETSGYYLRRITKKTTVETIEQIIPGYVRIVDFEQPFGLPFQYDDLRFREPPNRPVVEKMEVAEIDDSEERRDLARVIGLSVVPQRTDAAFESMLVVFDGLAREAKPSAVEAVRLLRRMR